MVGRDGGERGGGGEERREGKEGLGWVGGGKGEGGEGVVVGLMSLCLSRRACGCHLSKME